MKTFITAFLVVCAIIGPCSSLECYTCDGGDDCADPFNVTSAVTTVCNGSTPMMCYAFEDRGEGSFSRKCLPAEQCTETGCISAAYSGVEWCSYCCDGDRCNNRSVADAVADVLHCYSCFYLNSSANYNNTCDYDIFDPNVEGAMATPCEGECGIAKSNIPIFKGYSTARGCFSPKTMLCQPGCNNQGTCMTCCSENLCNGGPAPTPEPNRAPSLMSTRRSATVSLAAIPLMYIASLN